MVKILLVDSWLLNNKVIEQDVVEYFNNHKIEYQFFESDNEKDALEFVKMHDIDMAYIDISSQEYDGIQLLKDIKALDIRQPKITAVTVLYDKKYRYEALKLGVYRYIYKPYDYREIEESLEKLFKDNYYSKESNRISSTINAADLLSQEDSSDDFIDFDEDDDSIEHSKELMDAYNDSHKKVSAKEFLEECGDVGINTEELEDLEEELDRVVANILFDNNLEGELPDIIYILEKYNRFLYMFSEFEELSKVLYGLIELLQSIDFSSLARITMVSKFIVAIIQDLVDWKEHVFVIQDAVDVYYINASILNSFVQLKDIIKK
ncbi:MAG: response regulator [Arcobacteraceae bacterium]|nr:response regulator [Arcobacteraceae bacterium]